MFTFLKSREALFHLVMFPLGLTSCLLLATYCLSAMSSPASNLCADCMAFGLTRGENIFLHTVFYMPLAFLIWHFVLLPKTAAYFHLDYKKLEVQTMIYSYIYFLVLIVYYSSPSEVPKKVAETRSVQQEVLSLKLEDVYYFHDDSIAYPFLFRKSNNATIFGPHPPFSDSLYQYEQTKSYEEIRNNCMQTVSALSKTPCLALKSDDYLSLYDYCQNKSLPYNSVLGFSGFTTNVHYYDSTSQAYYCLVFNNRDRKDNNLYLVAFRRDKSTVYRMDQKFEYKNGVGYNPGILCIMSSADRFYIVGHDRILTFRLPFLPL